MQCSLPTFDLKETLRCGREIRKVVRGAPTLEEGAQRMCELLYRGLLDADGRRPGTVLVRCYATLPFGNLSGELRGFVSSRSTGAVSETTKCLVLLGTAGEEPAWNDRLRSRGHLVIPLPSPDVVEQAPMIAALFKDFGVEVQSFIAPQGSLKRDLRARTYGVFHVENAVGSSAIPAQEDFVVRYEVKSVVGCGGELPRGELFATILFCRVPVSSQVAERFQALALDMKAAFFPFASAPPFAAVGKRS